ncbi:MAG TPA: DUF3788 family protein [Clostridia bacterium]|jgi:hypothetical protein|nr:DUF3788 family protein [Clostridia bacterium]HQM38755.1 DUF3788 family protein [Clostridia bacterium]
MSTTKEQLLRNPYIQPTSEVIKEALGDANSIYIRFIDELTKYNIDLEWRYYTDGKAWLAKGLYTQKGVRGGKNVTTVFWLSIWNGFFKVSIFVPEISRKDALNLPLSNQVKQMITDAKQMGKLKFLPVIFDFYTDELFEDVFTLVEVKKTIYK